MKEILIGWIWNRNLVRQLEYLAQEMGYKSIQALATMLLREAISHYDRLVARDLDDDIPF